jgi:hypothetical protein
MPPASNNERTPPDVQIGDHGIKSERVEKPQHGKEVCEWLKS